ncbi:hypothetical protein G6514_008298 [Epicoccum nigrum]|nr:hypothetical protein G6514_008298 [Epicoccum nigrum]
MVDSHCHFSKSDSDSDIDGELEARSKLPHRFLINVMNRYAKMIKSKDELTLDIRDYHNHSLEEDIDTCDTAWGDMAIDFDDDVDDKTNEASHESHEEGNLEDEVRDLEDDLIKARIESLKH